MGSRKGQRGAGLAHPPPHSIPQIVHFPHQPHMNPLWVPSLLSKHPISLASCPFQTTGQTPLSHIMNKTELSISCGIHTCQNSLWRLSTHRKADSFKTHAFLFLLQTTEQSRVSGMRWWGGGWGFRVQINAGRGSEDSGYMLYAPLRVRICDVLHSNGSHWWPLLQASSVSKWKTFNKIQWQRVFPEILSVCQAFIQGL